MDTMTTIQSLLQCDGSAQPVTVALMPSERRLIAAAPDLLEALKITRMQLAVSAAGKIALSHEKHLSIVDAALSKAGA